jgi:hypothetical protein
MRLEDAEHLVDRALRVLRHQTASLLVESPPKGASARLTPAI